MKLKGFKLMALRLRSVTINLKPFNFSTKMKNQHTLGILAVLIGATVWSTGGLCIKLLPYDPYTILF